MKWKDPEHSTFEQRIAFIVRSKHGMLEIPSKFQGWKPERQAQHLGVSLHWWTTGESYMHENHPLMETYLKGGYRPSASCYNRQRHVSAWHGHCHDRRRF